MSEREVERIIQWWREIGFDAAIAAHERGTLSEGQAAKMLGIRRVDVRKAADKLRNDGGVYHDGLTRRIVRVVERSGECSPSDVAEVLGESIARVAQNMCRMQARGYLVRPARGRYTLPPITENR